MKGQYLEQDHRFDIGQVINRLTVLEQTHKKARKGALYPEHTYLTVCECGEERNVFQTYLTDTRLIQQCKSCAYASSKAIRKKVTGVDPMIRHYTTMGLRIYASPTPPGADPAPFDRIHRRLAAA